MRKFLIYASVLASPVVFSGCVLNGSNMNNRLSYGPTPMQEMQFAPIPTQNMQGVVSASPNSRSLQDVMPNERAFSTSQPSSMNMSNMLNQTNMQVQQQAKYLSVVSERMKRLERAVIRLDKRMKLLERNELARISNYDDAAGDDFEKNNPSGSFRPMSFDYNIPKLSSSSPSRYEGDRSNELRKPLPPVAVPRGAVTAERGMFRPVNVRPESSVITSSLQVAPKVNAERTMARNSHSSRNNFYSMPSIADENKATKAKRTDLEVWTVNYDNKKIWPERSELGNSQAIVEALRSDEPVALFARGANPASKEFRERVRALSKYLSKVADMENVPIASMPAEHLSNDTIEILLTR